MTTYQATALIAALALGCATNSTPTTQPGSDQEGVGGDHTGSGVQPPGGMTCRTALPGSVELQLAISGGEHVLMDLAGNIIYTADQGIVKVTPTGVQLFAFPYGSVAAVDASGDVYVAGSFTSPIDVGAGVMTPEGNIDVFVAKLSPRGELLFAKQLGLCGDGVEAIAVDRAGRIAISGTAMGTVVLSPSGDLQVQLAFAGQLAFDSRGELIVAGSFTGSIDLGGHVLTAASSTDIDSFVVKLDANGNYMTSVQLGDAPLPFDTGLFTITLPQSQVIASIAINAHDELAVMGTFPREMDLFGQLLKFNGQLPSGGTLSRFVFALDASFGVVFAEGLGEFYSYNPAGAVAIDNLGRVILSSNGPSEAFFPYGFPQLGRLDAAGNGDASFRFALDPTLRGYGLGVAVDACGNIAWANTQHASVLDQLQPTLRLIAP